MSGVRSTSSDAPMSRAEIGRRLAAAWEVTVRALRLALVDEPPAIGELRKRVETLESQVRSLQCAAPKGIDHR